MCMVVLIVSAYLFVCLAMFFAMASVAILRNGGWKLGEWTHEKNTHIWTSLCVSSLLWPASLPLVVMSLVGSRLRRDAFLDAAPAPGVDSARVLPFEGARVRGRLEKRRVSEYT